MGLNLCIANSIDEIYKGLELENLRLDDKLRDFIWENREILSLHIEIYEKLEPYDNIVLCGHEILELRSFAETLLDLSNLEALNFSKEYINENIYVSKDEYVQFAKNLKTICDRAISLNKNLYSIGD